MTDRVRDARGVYQLASELDATQQAHAELRFDKGTLLLEHCAQLPTALNAYFTFDPRVSSVSSLTALTLLCASLP